MLQAKKYKVNLATIFWLILILNKQPTHMDSTVVITFINLLLLTKIKINCHVLHKKSCGILEALKIFRSTVMSV